MTIHHKTLAELSQMLQKKTISSVELTQIYLNRCKDYDPILNSFITLDEEGAIQKATIADQKIAGDDATKLTGIPIAHKDIFCSKQLKTSCGSKMLDNFIAPYDATIVQRLNETGMVTIGKTNMDEFAMGSSTETSYYGPTLNPWNKKHVPGGSSGGSACAVAARISPAATATDTGGSIRQPASFCGVTGFKPTYGRVSRYGMIAFASSLDQGGTITKTAEDAALLMNVMAGVDQHDSTSKDQPVDDYYAHLEQNLTGLKIGLPKQYFSDDLNAEVAQTINDALKIYEQLGMQCIEIDLPNTELCIPAYYIIAPAECSSNLARYDGVRYGYRCESPKNLDDLYIRSRSEGFGVEVKRRIMIGTYVLSSGYYDAYYLKAQRIRQSIQNDFEQAFQQVDIIATPTTTGCAFKLNEKLSDPVSMYLSDLYTASVNLAGLPAISIPAGFVNQLPIGLQLIGNHFAEQQILNAAHQYQKVTDWHTHIPEEYQ